MKRVVAIVAACWFIGTLVAAPVPKDPVGDELKAVEGKWKFVALINYGRVAPAEELEGPAWEFKHGDVSGKDLNDYGVIYIKIDPKKDPKHIDIVVPDGQDKELRIEGIYKMEKGQLTICFRDTKTAKYKGRPTEFKAGAEIGIVDDYA